jgi:hypothetical protein
MMEGISDPVTLATEGIRDPVTLAVVGIIEDITEGGLEAGGRDVPGVDA